MSNEPDKHDLAERYKKEEVFHDEKYTGEDTSPKHYEVNPTFRIFQRMIEMIGDVKGKKILEFGCGDGWMTAELASRGAFVDSFDISNEAVKCTTELLEKHNLSENTRVRKMGAEELDYETEEFDIVFGFAILHHLDLDKAIPELHRVIKPGGFAIFAEPLEDNPALKVYRFLTPQYRTVDEQPIVIKTFANRLNQFSSFKHEEFYLTALIAFIFIYIPGMSRFFDSIVKPFLALDRFLLKRFPFMSEWAWYSIFVLNK